MISKRSALSLSAAFLLVAGCALVDSRVRTRRRTAADGYPPNGRFVEVDGRRVHYVQAGTGPDVVLLHGASGNVRDFTLGFMARLTDRYRVTAFDRPGLGHTDPEPAFTGPFDARAEDPVAQARILARATKRIGIRDEVVLGHSYGGAVAMAWALDHDPAAAVIVSGATQPWPGGLGPLYNFTGTSLGGAIVVPLISAFAPETLVSQAIAAVFAPQDPPANYTAQVGAALALRAESFRTNAQQVKSLRPHLVKMAPRYRDLRLPLEIVHGTADEIVPIHIHSEPLARQVSHARLTRLDGIGHMPHHVAADEVTAAIDRAVARAGLR
jgi:pimeloyl-ACP methyl ester carboxylesterase